MPNLLEEVPDPTREAPMSKDKEQLLRELVEAYKVDSAGPEALLSEMISGIAQAALEGEMTAFLGYEKHDPAGNNSGNSRNGYSKKTVQTELGEVELSVPRDRNGEFEPQLVQKGERRTDRFVKNILSMYANGMSVRAIRDHLAELYGVDVSPDVISRVTDSVMDELKTWRNRQLDRLYPIVFLDALVVKVRDQGRVANMSLYVAMAINLEGQKEILGLWLAGTEGAKFWLSVLNSLRNRGVEDMLIVCCDGLKGFPEAIENVFPYAVVQTCIVHMVRNSLRFVSWKERKAIAKALKPIYRAATVEQAEMALDAFEETWGSAYPGIVSSWRKNWERVTPFFDFAPEIRRVIYTTNPIESLNSQLRRAIKQRGHFPNEDALMKALYLKVRQIETKWTMATRDWGRVIHQMAIHFNGRINL